jgi:hypothetical protein
MKKIRLPLLTLALIALLALTAGSTAVSDRDADRELRAVNERLYPDSVEWIDWICDGVADCVPLP